jgi:hypothetical protein
MQDIVNIIKNDYINDEKQTFSLEIQDRINEIVFDCNKLLSDDKKLKNVNEFYIKNHSFKLFMNLQQYIYCCCVNEQNLAMYELMILIILKMHIENIDTNISETVNNHSLVFYNLTKYNTIQNLYIESDFLGKFKANCDKLHIIETVKHIYKSHLDKVNCKLNLLNSIQ